MGELVRDDGAHALSLLARRLGLQPSTEGWMEEHGAWGMGHRTTGWDCWQEVTAGMPPSTSVSYLATKQRPGAKDQEDEYDTNTIDSFSCRCSPAKHEGGLERRIDTSCDETKQASSSSSSSC